MSFENHQWAVTRVGLEVKKPEPEYVIYAERLTETTERGGDIYYDWPVHMAEKTWVNIEAFIEAFQKALKEHNATFDSKMLAASIEVARKIAERRY